ncbi:MAG: homoserine dehydrogenase [Rhodospirillales bacterium]|nr:homoserine dehydrogenase [Rhodospirillales bacterium]MBO6786585.1 homoserine dehydrogenase [Rhodospirillales bacterium]
MNVLRIGIAGLGTVGAGTVKVIETHKELLARRAGCAIEITAVSARSKSLDRGIDIDAYRWYDDPTEMADADDIDLVVELIGGSDGVAKALAEKALAAGKHVVTANKALIAHHGSDLAAIAEKSGAAIYCEAAVAGGIPILKGLREGLAANSITRVYGILNGTCNYILTEMRDTGRSFDDVLEEAQKLGYAEADPTFDVDGIDTAHKLAILSALSFGTKIDFDGIHVEGIRDIAPIDIQFAEELGFGIKLLGIASIDGDVIEQRVHACMVPIDAPINHVEGSFNAVVADGDFVDTVLHEGRGAGGGPTASAVVADIIDIARGHRVPLFGVPASKLLDMPTRPMERHQGAYYVRFNVVDKPGVFADIAGALTDNDVSMESVLQRSRDPGQIVPVVMTLHETEEAAMRRAVEQISNIGAVVEPPVVIRIEAL